tara:strand:- start:57339 stop:57698 length:360 start_codon:yes stop_codon:yes gene_type:complete
MISFWIGWVVVGIVSYVITRSNRNSYFRSIGLQTNVTHLIIYCFSETKRRKSDYNHKAKVVSLLSCAVFAIGGYLTLWAAIHSTFWKKSYCKSILCIISDAGKDLPKGWYNDIYIEEEK